MRSLRSKAELVADVGSLRQGDVVTIKSKANSFLGVPKVVECVVKEDDAR